MTRELAKLNFRDVGGLATADGSRVAEGVVFRSEGPASFGPGHRKELEALGFRLVCDLRSATEREKSPNDWAGSARLLNLDINTDLRASPGELLSTMGDDPSLERLKHATLQNYSLTPAALRPRMRSLVEAIAGGETPRSSIAPRVKTAPECSLPSCCWRSACRKTPSWRTICAPPSSGRICGAAAG